MAEPRLITFRNDTAPYLQNFDPSTAYKAHKAEIDEHFDAIAKLISEDPQTPARTALLLTYVTYERVKAAFDYTSALALSMGSEALENAAQKLHQIIHISYVVQEKQAGREAFKDAAPASAPKETTEELVQRLREQGLDVKLVKQDELVSKLAEEFPNGDRDEPRKNLSDAPARIGDNADGNGRIIG